MSIQQVWLNLPVRDLERSKAFYRHIGFRVNPMHEKASHLASFLIGARDFVLMLFPEHAFRGFVNNEIADLAKGTEMLINIDAQSREEVDQLADRVREAGGLIYAEPGETQGWMYAFGFADPDGHRWSMLHMDVSRMPAK